MRRWLSGWPGMPVKASRFPIRALGRLSTQKYPRSSNACMASVRPAPLMPLTITSSGMFSSSLATSVMSRISFPADDHFISCLLIILLQHRIQLVGDLDGHHLGIKDVLQACSLEPFEALEVFEKRLLAHWT